MKRWIAQLLTLLLLAGLIPASAEQPEAGEEEEIPTELRVGNPTPMDGKFFTGCWGNATSDIDVRTLVHGYRLIAWDGEFGMFRENRTTVKDLAVAENQEGDRLYFFELYDDLYYSDGTPITAWDYAFSALFQGSPILSELGALPMNLEYLEGFDAYAAGETKVISGLRVLEPYILSFQVRKEFLPYFFELYRFAFVPYPIHEIAPGCRVYDDGEGCYIGNVNPEITEPLFTADLLRSTVMDPENGYLSYPTVGSGPYRLLDWDGRTCHFEINPYFKGDEDGNVPTIPRLEYTLAVNETMIDQLISGEFGLLNKVTRQDTILEGLEKVMSTGRHTMTNYPRIGLTFIVFTPDRPALQQLNVRHAMAHCLEKEDVVREYVGNFGQEMDGLIGLGQWMYGLIMGTLPYPVEEGEEGYEDWQELSLENLKKYPLNIDEANRLLDEAGWTLNRQGGEYRPGEDDVRCREIDGELVAMDLTCAYPETNITAGSLETLFLPNLAQAGIKVTLIPMDMKSLLRAYNDRDIEEIDMFYLGDDFNVEFDPTLFFLDGNGEVEEADDLTYVHDLMYQLADDMVRTEPSDVLGFMQKWVRFQEELSEQLPLIPVYSNIYFDFYTAHLQNYDILPKVTWGDAIVGATLGAIGTPEEENPDDDSFFDD